VSWLEDDIIGPEVTVVEDTTQNGHRQALSVRVGPVFYQQEERGPVVWITYQPEYMESAPFGPVLMDMATWNALDRAVRKRARRWRKRTWRRWVTKRSAT
jgi:hypothetical protein